MKKSLLFIFLLAFCLPGFSQSFLFEEYFDGGILPNTWANIDQDGDGLSWYADTWDGNPNVTLESYVVSASYDKNHTPKALTPENYLVSPKIDLTGLHGTVSLRYTIQVGDDVDFAEHYKVAVSTTGNTVADFTNNVKEETCTVDDYYDTYPYWHPRTIDLTPFIGQKIYLSFCHYNCTNMLKFYLDSVQVSYTPVIQTKDQVLFYTTCATEGGGVHKVVLTDEGAPVVTDFATVPLTKPYGITVDTTNQKVYVSDYSVNAIYRFDADGTNPVKILDNATEPMVDAPEALMVVGDKLYWGQPGGIYRCNLDGTSPEVYNANIDYPTDMLYEPGTNKIHLVIDMDDKTGGYFTANLDGTAYTNPIPQIDGTALDIDQATGKAYIAGYAVAGTAMPDNAIYSSNLDGTQVTKIGDYGAKATWGIALDHKRNKLFWSFKNSNYAQDGKIVRANVDGTGVEDFITGINPQAMEIAWVKPVTNVSVKENASTTIQVYPNPVSNQLTVNGDFVNARMEIYTLNGKLVYTSESKSREAKINVSGLKSGMYILRIKSNNTVVNKKISITH